MATLILNPAAVRQTAINKALPMVKRVLQGTETLAKAYAPVRSPRDGDRRATGRLRRSIHKHGPRILKNRIVGDIGSRQRYAMAVHEGAVPHIIVARQRLLLSFFWEKRGVWFVGRRVNHPGVRRFARTQYLYLPLSIVGRREGFIVRRTAGGGIASPLADI